MAKVRPGGPGWLGLAAALALTPTARARADGPLFAPVSVSELRSRGGETGELEGGPVQKAPVDRRAVAESAYPYALLSADSYHGGVEGWCRPIEHRSDPETGFDAYACRVKATGRVIVAFRGTDELKDWVKTDIPQPLVLPRQYRQGYEYAKELKEAYGDVAVTGHSMGGGIAQYAAARLGLEAWTFNPAGLGLAAGLKMGSCPAGEACKPDASRITNVVVAGEPLAAARFFLGPDFVRLHGSVVHFLPAGGGGLTSHGMSNVLAALEAKRDKPAPARLAALDPR